MTLKGRLIISIMFAVATLVFLAYGPALAYTPGDGIASTPHDFRGYTGVADDDSTASTISLTADDAQICVYCHVPHNSKKDGSSVPIRPIWNHNVDTTTSWASGTNYWATTFNETALSAPSGVSILCLSCHDGVIAVDAYGSNAGTTFIPSSDSTFLGTDMRDDHPISVAYPSSGLPNSSFIAAPVGVKVDFGGVARVECASCHDPHNANVATTGLGIGKFLRVKLGDSAICLSCHDK